jgi:hypothetical protein
MRHLCQNRGETAGQWLARLHRIDPTGPEHRLRSLPYPEGKPGAGSRRPGDGFSALDGPCVGGVDMTPDEMVNLLMSFERRLATLADQAHETREQAQHTLDRINRLRRDLELVKDRLTSSIDTINYVPLSPDTLR